MQAPKKVKAFTAERFIPPLLLEMLYVLLPRLCAQLDLGGLTAFPRPFFRAEFKDEMQLIPKNTIVTVRRINAKIPSGDDIKFQPCVLDSHAGILFLQFLLGLAGSHHYTLEKILVPLFRVFTCTTRDLMCFCHRS
jgi:hypothetical protein